MPSTTSRAARGSPGSASSCSAALLAWGAAGVIASTDAPEGARIRRLGGAALALGAAVWVKPHAIVLVSGARVLDVVGVPRPGARRALAAVGLGVALPGLAMLAWLGWTGGLGAFADITLGYLLPLYSRLGRNDLLHEIAVRDYGAAVLAGLAAWAASASSPSPGGGGGGSSASWPAGLAYGAAHFWVAGTRDGSTTSTRSRSSRRRWAAPGSGRRRTAGRRALGVALVLALAVTAGALWIKGQRNLAPAWIEAKLGRVGRVDGGAPADRGGRGHGAGAGYHRGRESMRSSVSTPGSPAGSSTTSTSTTT